jgi:hypothetical protein
MPSERREEEDGRDSILSVVEPEREPRVRASTGAGDSSPDGRRRGDTRGTTLRLA